MKWVTDNLPTDYIICKAFSKKLSLTNFVIRKQ